MRGLSNLLITFVVISVIGLSGLGKADAQAPKPTKKQCVEQLSPTLTKAQKAELVEIKKEQGASKEQKLGQFIAALSPAQKTQFEGCMKASK
jgi:hypothetical protein